MSSSSSVYLRDLDAHLVAYMHIKKLNMDDIASKIGICRASLSLKRNGKRDYTAPELLRLCHILGVSVDEVCMPDFLEQTEKEPSAN